VPRFIALSGNAGFCPHCNDMLKAFEIIDSNTGNDSAISFSVVQDLKPDDPVDIEVLRVTKGAAPAIALDDGDVYVGSGDYEMLLRYFSTIMEVDIWTL